MLVLRRKQGEAIVLNNVVVIRVLSVEGDRVKLGIDAPPDVIVVREELLENPEPVPSHIISQPTYGVGEQSSTKQSAY